jgi:PBP1b-binding outer membrane lipoprotein LpoB
METKPKPSVETKPSKPDKPTVKAKPSVEVKPKPSVEAKPSKPSVEAKPKPNVEVKPVVTHKKKIFTGAKAYTPASNYKEYLKNKHNIDKISNAIYAKYKEEDKYDSSIYTPVQPWYNYIPTNMIIP